MVFMKEEVEESLRVYLTSTAASVSALYIFNELIKTRLQTPAPTPRISSQWNPLSTKEIKKIKSITGGHNGT